MKKNIIIQSIFCFTIFFSFNSCFKDPTLEKKPNGEIKQGDKASTQNLNTGQNPNSNHNPAQNQNSNLNTEQNPNPNLGQNSNPNTAQNQNSNLNTEQNPNPNLGQNSNHNPVQNQNSNLNTEQNHNPNLGQNSNPNPAQNQNSNLNTEQNPNFNTGQNTNTGQNPNTGQNTNSNLGQNSNPNPNPGQNSNLNTGQNTSPEPAISIAQINSSIILLRELVKELRALKFNGENPYNLIATITPRLKELHKLYDDNYKAQYEDQNKQPKEKEKTSLWLLGQTFLEIVKRSQDNKLEKSTDLFDGLLPDAEKFLKTTV